MPPVIEVQDLTKTYRDGLFRNRRIEALKGVSFSVQPGEIFGLLGPNGAGKTTIIKLLLGVVRKTSGHAQLLGFPAGDRRGRRQVGYLPENHRIPRHHTANTALEYYGSLSGLSGSQIRARRQGLLDAVGLSKWGPVSVRKYSKGMQQRLGLAQALLHDPQILILDEPTDGVDPVGRSEMRALLQEQRRQGKTIFLNSHLLQEIELVCDKVLILNHGQVLKESLVKDLTQQNQTEVQFTLRGDARAMHDAIGQRATSQFKTLDDGDVEVSFSSIDQLATDRLIDDLRRAGVSVVSVVPMCQTLEEAFIDIVQGAQRTA